MKKFKLPKGLRWDVVRLGGKTPTEWYNAQKEKPVIMFSGSFVHWSKETGNIPLGTIIEDGKQVKDSGNGYGMGITKDGALGFGTPWLGWNEYFTGFTGSVVNGKYVPPSWSDPAFNSQPNRIGFAMDANGDCYVIMVDEGTTLEQFSNKAMSAGMVSMSNHDGGGSRYLLFEGEWHDTSTRDYLYNAVVAYDDAPAIVEPEPEEQPEPHPPEDTEYYQEVTLVSTEKQSVYTEAGLIESGRYISEGDVCAIGDVTINGLIRIYYPTSSGYRAAFVLSLSKFKPDITVFNQRDYPNMPYPAPGYESATVASGGCGPTSMAMVLSRLGFNVDVEGMVELALECGARVSGGTNMKTLSEAVADEWDVDYQTTSDWQEAELVLKRGGAVIANVGGDRSGHTGIFSTGGHYIFLAAMINDTVMGADAYMYDGKFDSSYRSKYVQINGDYFYTSWEALELDCANRSPRYYLYERI